MLGPSIYSLSLCHSWRDHSGLTSESDVHSSSTDIDNDVCVYAAVCMVGPDVCVTQRSVSQLLAPHCHSLAQLTPALRVSFPFSVI